MAEENNEEAVRGHAQPAAGPPTGQTTAVVQFGCVDQVAQECRELLAEAMLEVRGSGCRRHRRRRPSLPRSG